MKKIDNTLFSPKLYWQGIKKIRAIGIAAAICVIIPNALIAIIAAIQRNSLHIFHSQHKMTVSISLFAPFSLFMLIFAPLMVYFMFSFLNERKKSDFYHSVPQTRTCVFLSFAAAVLTWISAILLVGTVLNIALWNMVKLCELELSVALNCFFGTLIASFLMASFMCVAMSITGTLTSNMLIFTLITLFTNVVGYIFIECLETITPVFVLSGSWLRLLDFEHFLPYQLINCTFNAREEFPSVFVLLYSFAIAALLIALACLFYKQRRSETAGQSAPNKIFQTVFRSAVTFPFLLPLVWLAMEGDMEISFLLIFLSVALIVYAMFELITTRKLKSMFKSLMHFYIPALAALVFFGGVYAAHFGIASVQPESDEIKSVKIVYESDTYYYGSGNYEDMMTFGIEVSSEEVNKIISDALKENIEHMNDGRYYSTEYTQTHRIDRNVVIKLESGVEITRQIRFTVDEVRELRRQMANASEEYRNALIAIPDISGIYEIWVTNHIPEWNENQSFKSYIWNMFESEYNALSTEEKVELKLYTAYPGNENDKEEYYVYVDAFQDGWSYYYLDPDTMPKTYERVAKYAYRQNTEDSIKSR